MGTGIRVAGACVLMRGWVGRVEGDVSDVPSARKYKSGDNLALLGPSLMFHAFCARFAAHANSDRATHEIRCASGSVCNGSVGNLTSKSKSRA